jgi:cellulase (glycosyl hydrolase family 5)
MRSRPLVTALAIVVVAVLVLGGVYLATRGGGSTSGAPTTTPAPPKAMQLGIQDDALLTSAEPKAVPTVTALHPHLIRFNIVWSDIAPTKPKDPADPADPAYNWANADKLVGLATQLKAAVLFTIVDAPKWANGGKDPQYAPTDPADFGTFCGAVAKRYPVVLRYTIWNEPNRGQFLQPQGAGGTEAPKQLAGLAGACIPKIRAQSADAKIAIGPVASRGGQGGLPPITFLADYRAAGGPRPDAVALNPYLEGQAPLFLPTERPEDGAVTIRNLDWLERKLQAAYGRTMPIWLTEFAVRTVPPVTYADQAVQLRQSVQLVRTHYPYVPLLIWFLLRDQGPHDYWRSGLVDTPWHRKPAFAVFKAFE